MKVVMKAVRKAAMTETKMDVPLAGLMAEEMVGLSATKLVDETVGSMVENLAEVRVVLLVTTLVEPMARTWAGASVVRSALLKVVMKVVMLAAAMESKRVAWKAAKLVARKGQLLVELLVA